MVKAVVKSFLFKYFISKMILNISQLCCVCVGTVSYTHLDVYKRQDSSNGEMKCR